MKLNVLSSSILIFSTKYLVSSKPIQQVGVNLARRFRFMLFFIPVDSTQNYCISKNISLLTQSYCDLERNALRCTNCVAVRPIP